MEMKEAPLPKTWIFMDDVTICSYRQRLRYKRIISTRGPCYLRWFFVYMFLHTFYIAINVVVVGGIAVAISCICDSVCFYNFQSFFSCPVLVSLFQSNVHIYCTCAYITYRLCVESTKENCDLFRLMLCVTHNVRAIYSNKKNQTKLLRKEKVGGALGVIKQYI